MYMALSPQTVRAQIKMLLPLFRSCSLDTIRRGQNRIGGLMEVKHRHRTYSKVHAFDRFDGAWILPKDERRQGVILYLHGGGYVCGDLEYAKGFGSTLAVECGVKVFCAAYRLAPENPWPAQLEDALDAYRYLLGKGYAPEHIVLCGESAGGGLCYSLCMKLKELNISRPGGIIAISPWTDLTASGESYVQNREVDVSMTAEQLSFFAKCCEADPRDPMISPALGDLRELPSSLIFVGKEEIMLSDSCILHEKLLKSGGKSQLLIKPDRWHGYLLYGLAEDRGDFSVINKFLNSNLSREHKLRWLPLDNAAKIYPAARRQNWSNVYRISATLTEEVDKEVLQAALDVTIRRFPSIAARLRRGVFWYYLQQLSQVPKIREEYSFPLAPMSPEEIRRCAFRVIVHKKRIALEMFHSLTDGSGAMIFLKTLLAEYLQQKHGVYVPAEKGVFGRLEEPSEAELEDSFQKYAGNVTASRQSADAWRIRGTLEADGFRHVTCFKIPVKAALEKAHENKVSLTAFLCAVMMQAIQNLQKEKVPNFRRRKPIKVLMPVNLRNLFPSDTLRNFALFTAPEIDPRLGEYTFQEICNAVRHRMGLEINRKHMSALIAANVNSERILAVRIMPLFIKNIILKLAFDIVGERKTCLSLSNLGAIVLPDEMKPYVERFDVILGNQATNPYNCGVLSYNDVLYINIIRNIREPELEYHFHKVLQEIGLPVTVESNRCDR